MLESLAGEITVEDACARLGLERSRFFELRGIALQAALDGLAPRPLGRPRKLRDERPREERLEERIFELENELVAERVRSEIALVMPRVFTKAGGAPPRGANQFARNRATNPKTGTTRG
jgi:hypothetical protein